MIAWLIIWCPIDLKKKKQQWKTDKVGEIRSWGFSLYEASTGMWENIIEILICRLNNWEHFPIRAVWDLFTFVFSWNIVKSVLSFLLLFASYWLLELLCWSMSLLVDFQGSRVKFPSFICLQFYLFYFMYFEAPLFGAYTFGIAITSWCISPFCHYSVSFIVSGKFFSVIYFIWHFTWLMYMW